MNSRRDSSSLDRVKHSTCSNLSDAHEDAIPIWVQVHGLNYYIPKPKKWPCFSSLQDDVSGKQESARDDRVDKNQSDYTIQVDNTEKEDLGEESKDEASLKSLLLPKDGLDQNIQKKEGYSSNNSFHILKNIDVNFCPGTLTCIMGPSGAGKTTLMSVLIDNAAGIVDGSIQINGRDLNNVRKQFKKLCTFVPQDDILLSSFTVYETLDFASRLRLPSSWHPQEKKEKIFQVLDDLSLVEQQNTRVGSVEERGLSGGQRKRVSIALELLVNPSVMFVDEPTSGLDSKMAEDVIRLLNNLAKQGSGRTIVSTIHQPSYKTFCIFDRLLLLKGGEVVYSGPVKRAEEYFTNALGFSTPHGENPADFMMSLVQISDLDVQSKLNIVWSTVGCREYKIENDGELPELVEDLSLMDFSGANAQLVTKAPFSQFTILFERTLRDSLKDKDKFLTQFSLKLSVGLLIGIVWVNQYGNAQSNIFPTTGALFIATVSSILDTLTSTVNILPLMKALLLREYKNSYFDLMPYFGATLLVNVLFNIFYSICMGTPIWFLVGIYTQGLFPYFIFISVLSILSAIGVALGLAIGAVVKDFQAAQGVVMPTVVPLLMFSGYLIPYDQIKEVFRWIYFISPFAYSFRASTCVVFHGVTFEPEENCSTKQSPFCTGDDYLASTNAHYGDLGYYVGLLVVILTVVVFIAFYMFTKLVKQKTN
jgi:ABC-type multidrug transport system ATPase subunit/ABC-type multidrug transport system permease subunit